MNPKDALKPNMSEIRLIVSEMIYPPYVPPKCRPKIDALIYLLRNFHDTNDPPLQVQDGYDRAAFNKLDKLERPCHKYLLKYQEYRHRQEDEDNTINPSDTETSQDVNKQAIWKARAQVQIFNYHHCIAKEACPFRMEQLMRCWGKFGLDNIKQSIELGIEGQVCQREREMVQRCAGKYVETFIRDII